MNWERMQGEFKQVRGMLKQQWARLTDDDLLLLEGTKEVFVGRLQQRTGLAKAQVERQLDALIATVDLRRRPQGVVYPSAG